MALEDVANERAKIAAALCAELVHRVRAKHPIIFKLRFGEELVRGAFVRECFAPLVGERDVFCFASGTSVYQQIFPPNHIAFGYSAIVEHWLSRKPGNIPNEI